MAFDAQKLILVMLADIAEKVGSDEIDTKFVKAAVTDDHLWGLAWRYGHLVTAEQPKEVSEVVDILSVWDIIEMAHERFTPADREALEAKLAGTYRSPTFTGFDGNNEGKHMSAAMFLIDDMDRFARFKGRDMNGHHPALDRLLRMVRVYEGMRDSLPFGGRGPLLTVDQMVELLTA